MCHGRHHLILTTVSGKLGIAYCLLGMFLLFLGCAQQSDSPITDNLSPNLEQPVENEEMQNQIPVFVSSPVTSINFDEIYMYPAQAIDPDGDALEWSLETELEGLKINPQSGAIYGLNFSPGSYAITLKVNDGNGGNAEQSFSLSIKNNPGIFSTPPGNTFTGYNYKYQVLATAPDNSKLVYTLEAGPTGMVIDPQSGALQWDLPAVGEYRVTINVTSASGNTARQDYTLTVLDDMSLYIVSKPETISFVTRPYDYRVSAIGQTEKPKTYTVISGPPGISIDSSSGLLTWMPTTDGLYPIDIMVTDADGRTGSQSFAVQVYSLEEMDQIINGVLENVFDNLIAGDIDNASLFLSGEAQVKYLPILNELLPFMEEISGNLGSLERMSIDTNSAEYILPRTLNGETRLFIATFVRDVTGNWKLNSL